MGRSEATKEYHRRAYNRWYAQKRDAGAKAAYDELEKIHMRNFGRVDHDRIKSALQVEKRIWTRRQA